MSRFPRLTAAAVVGCLTLGIASPALAEGNDSGTDHDLSARCLEQIDRRLHDLDTAKARVATVDVLTDAHEATIISTIDATSAGLSGLATEIEATEDRPELVRLCVSIATDYRVYLVVLPQTHLTVGADRIDAAVTRGTELVATFDEAVEAAKDAGADVDEAVAFRDAAVAHLDAADVAADGVGDEVLAVTPADWNAGPGQTVIEASRTAVRTGHDEIAQGIEDGKAAIEALRAALDAIGSDA